MDGSPGLEGLIAAVFTPLHPDGSLRIEVIPAIVDHLIASGVSGIYICGSTGEGMSLTREERMETAEAYVDAAAGRLRTVVQVGHDSVAESALLAEHAAGLGVDALSATPPSYFRTESARALLDCCAAVAGAAPGTPFYYYHIPSLTGVDADLVELLRGAQRRIPNFVGIKYSHTDLSVLFRCQKAGSGAFDLLYGSDESLLGALAAGLRGAVGSTYNFAAPLYRRILSAVQEGNWEEARRLQTLAAEMVAAILQCCGRTGLKAVMSFHGLECGPHRLPLRDPSPGQVEELRKRLDALGFFSWARVEG